jgi:HlyD family secretion protein
MAMKPSDDDISQTLGLDTSPRGFKRSMRWALMAVLALVVIAGGWMVFFRDGDSGAPRYITAPVQRGELRVTVTATGTLEPTNQVEISSELSGIVRTVLVDHNDRVTKGQILAELDTDKLKAEVAHGRATLSAAKARLKESQATLGQSRSDFERYKKLLQSRAASEQKFDEAKAVYERAQAALESAKADVAVAEADLELKETDLKKACICSPVQGIVLVRNVDPGQTIASTFQAPVLFTVAEDLTKMELQVDVDEADVSLVQEGQSAQFTVDAYPDRVFPATITKVRFAPETTQGVVTYKAHLAVDNSALLLRPGMTATAEISVKTVKDALLIPNEALRFVLPVQQDAGEGRGLLGSILPRPPHRMASPNSNDLGDSSKRRIWVLKDGEPLEVVVTIGLSDGQRTSIVEGNLVPGQEVLIDEREASS